MISFPSIKKGIFIFPLLLLIVLLSRQLPARALSGTGSALDPFIIENCVDLVSATTTNAYYELGGDIDCSGQGQIGSLFDGGTFEGSFDGNGYTISGLDIYEEFGSAGLFSTVEGATIQNLVLAGAVESGADFVGSVAGYVDIGSTITNVTSTMTITGVEANIGGLFGILDGDGGVGRITVDNVSFDGQIVVNSGGGDVSYVGGLTGWAEYADISNVTSNVDITLVDGSITGVAGLLGQAEFVTVDNATVSGSLLYTGSGDLFSLGGVIGYADKASLSNTDTAFDMSLGSAEEGVSSAGSIGGVVGNYAGIATTTENIQADQQITVYATEFGTSQFIGGFAGYHCDDFLGCGGLYENITVSSSLELIGGEFTSVGGLFGQFSSGTLQYSSFDGNLTLLTDSNASFIGGIGGYVEDGTFVSNTAHAIITVDSKDAGAQVDSVAGFAGLLETNNSPEWLVDQAAVSGSITIGSVSTTDDVFFFGGLLGFASGVGSIREAEVNVDIDVTANGTATDVGGVFGAHDTILSAGNITVSTTYYYGDMVVDAPSEFTSRIGGIGGSLTANSDIIATVSNVFSGGSITIASGTSIGGLFGELNVDGQIDVSNTYSSANMISNMAVGGLVGYLTDGFGTGEVVISNSFYGGSFLNVSTSSGAIIHSLNAPTSSLLNNFYDQNAVGDADCLGELGGSIAECTGVNIGGVDADYFLGNSDEDPMNLWTFNSESWSILAGGFPYLSLLSNPYPSVVLGGSGTEPDPYLLTGCYTITEPGYYQLTQDVSNISTDCFVVEANNVTIDGNGHTISGTDALLTQGVVTESYDNLDVVNLFIEDFYDGIMLWNSTNSTVSGVRIIGSDDDAMDLHGVVLLTVSDSFISTSSDNGIEIYAYENTDAEEWYQSTGVTISSTTIQFTQNEPIIAEGVFYLTIEEVVIDTASASGVSLSFYDNTYEGVLYQSSRVTITSSTISNILSGDAIAGEGVDEIFIIGNTIFNVESDDGIDMDAYDNGYTNSTVSSTDISIGNNTITLVDDDGISIRGGDAITIYENSITSSTGSNGIDINSYTDVGTELTVAVTNVTIATNTITRTDQEGIELSGVEGATIRGNTIEQIFSDGVYFESVLNILFDQNSLEDISENGIEVDVANEVDITQNSFLDIGDDGIDTYLLVNGTIIGNTLQDIDSDGIYVQAGDEIIIRNNSLSDIGTDGIDLSIDEEGETNTNISILNNTLTDIGDNGIEVDELYDATISGNSLEIAGDGIAVDDSADILFIDNIITPTSQTLLTVPQITTAFTGVNINDAEDSSSSDDDSFTYELPFVFNFFGRDIVEIEVSTNGAIELLEDGESCEICDSYGPYSEYLQSDVIFASFDDLEMSSGDDTYVAVFNQDDESVIVQWNGSTYADDDADTYPMLFQVVLTPDGGIQWNFDTMQFNEYGSQMFSGVYDEEANDLYGVGFAIATSSSYAGDFSGNGVFQSAEFVDPNIGLDLDNVSDSTFVSNTIQAAQWVYAVDLADVVFNDEDSGNAYYFSDGNGAWTVFDILDSTGNSFADSGSDRPFASSTVGIEYWEGEGQDEYPYTLIAAISNNQNRGSRGGNTYTVENPLTRQIINTVWGRGSRAQVDDSDTKDKIADTEQDDVLIEEQEEPVPPALSGPQIAIDPTQTLQCNSTVYLTNPVRFGSNNNPADVRLLEEFLNTYENAGLVVNGVYDQVDVAAVIAWQEKYAASILAPWGLTQGTGYVYTTSLAKIKEIHEANCATATPTPPAPAAPAPSAQCLSTTQTLTLGMNNTLVTTAQQLLKTLGYFPADVNTTGYFGPITQTAVTAFQAANNIQQLGIIGPQTRARLNELGCSS